MSSREITVWLDKRWYDALSRQLKRKDTTIEDELNTYLDEMLNQLPAPVYERISREIWEEDQRQREAAKAAQPISVFRVTQDGRTDYLLTEGGGAMDTLHAALRLRTYLVDKDGSSERFAQTIPAADVISPEVFREHADAMRQDAERVTAALDIDLDRATFSTMAGADGWQTYTVSDVLAAAWNATIPHWSNWEARRCIFAEQLEDKLIKQEPTDISPPTGPTM